MGTGPGPDLPGTARVDGGGEVEIEVTWPCPDCGQRAVMVIDDYLPTYADRACVCGHVGGNIGVNYRDPDVEPPSRLRLTLDIDI